MWRTFIVGVFCWGQHKHLSHEAHPFLQVLPSHHLPMYVTVFKSGFMSFTDGQEQGGGGQWTPRARTEIEGNDQFVDQADMDTCFPLETTSMHQRTDLITYSWVWTRVIWVLLSWNSRKDSKMALCFLAEHHTVLLPVFLMPKITAES